MKFNPKSLYVLNKADPDAIIYSDVHHKIIRLTRADFDTEADFLLWKRWSDENYHEAEKREHIHADHTVPLENVQVHCLSQPSLAGGEAEFCPYIGTANCDNI